MTTDSVARSAEQSVGDLLGTDDPAWPELLRGSAHDFYHLPGYARLCAAEQGGEACALRVTDGQRTMLLPLVLRPIEGGRRDAASPYGYPGPIGPGTDDQDFLTAAFREGIDVLRGHGIVSLFVRFHPLLNRALPAGPGTLVHHGETVSIDLSLPAEDMWAAMRHNHRRDIKHAWTLGYRARMDPEWANVGAFQLLYHSTMDRHGAARTYYFSDRYLDGLREALDGTLHLCVTERAGEVVGAALFAETDGIVEYHLAGTDERGRAGHATKLMIQSAIEWARDRGNAVLHLGGGVGASRDSLLQFKLGFSSQVHRFSTLRVVLDDAEYSRLTRQAGNDPALQGGAAYFPAYRSVAHAPTPGSVS